MSKTASGIFILLLLGHSLFGDYLESRPVGPDIVYHHEFRSQGPWHLQVVEIDLENSHVELETIKAGDLLNGYERTSQMASQADSEAHRVVAAINGDFYGTGGIPVGAQVINGKFLKREYHRSTFGVGDAKQPFIEIVDFNGQLRKADSLIAGINTVNAARQENFLTLYNRYVGNRTGTNQWGTEVMCEWIDSPLVNAPRAAVVVAKDSTQATDSGNNIIPAGGFVLSGHGSAKTALDESVFIGDTIMVELNFAPVDHPIKQLVGGTPRIIRNGLVSVEWEAEGISPNFATDRHPRTAVGFSADSSRVFFFTVDGRQPGYSVGMSLYELANYMLEWDVHQGINLDGGGSTTMVVRGSVANSPSDAGGERSVANALMVINTAPTGSLAILEVNPHNFYTLTGTQQQMDLLGFDSTYNPLPVPTDSIVWSCAPGIGSIDTEGLFTAGTVPGYGMIVGAVGTLTDTAWVTVTQVDSIWLTPEPVILEVDQSQQMAATAYDDAGNQLNLENGDYEWWVTPGLGTINNIGLFSAYAYGTGMIRASYGGVADSVTVAVGSSQAVVFDDFSSVDQWSLSGVIVNLSECHLSVDSSIFISEPSSGRLDYALSTGGTSALYLNTELSISGSPDAVFLDIYGDGAGHWLRGEFRDTDGDRFLVNFTESDPGIDWNGSWQTVQLDLEDATPHWGNPSAVLNFPITWTRIYMAETDDANKNSGAIYLDNFGVSYLTVDTDTESMAPAAFNLQGPYPNPFNGETVFRFDIPQSGPFSLKIFDLQGRLVFEKNDRVNGYQKVVRWQPEQSATGLYLFRATHAEATILGKCLLLK